MKKLLSICLCAALLAACAAAPASGTSAPPSQSTQPPAAEEEAAGGSLRPYASMDEFLADTSWWKTEQGGCET